MTTPETLPERQQASSVPLFPIKFSAEASTTMVAQIAEFLLVARCSQRLAFASHCATEHNHQKDQLCQLLEDHLPCSGWRELLGGPNLTTRCGDSCQSAVEGRGLLKGLSSWLWLLPFISPNPQDVDCILTAIGSPLACLWCRICVLKHRQHLSHLPTFLHLWQWLMSTWRMALYLWARPCKYASVLPTWTSQIGSGQFWNKNKETNRNIDTSPQPKLRDYHSRVRRCLAAGAGWHQ